MENSYESVNLENTFHDDVMNFSLSIDFIEKTLNEITKDSELFSSQLADTPTEIEQPDEAFFSGYCHDVNDYYLQPASSFEHASTDIDGIEMFEYDVSDVMQICPTLVLPEHVNTTELFSEFLHPSVATAESCGNIQLGDNLCYQTGEIAIETFRSSVDEGVTSSSWCNDLDLDALFEESQHNNQLQLATTIDNDFDQFFTSNQPPELNQAMTCSSVGAFESHVPAAVPATEFSEQTTTTPIQINVNIQPNSSNCDSSPYQATWSYNCSSSLLTPESQCQEPNASKKRKYTRKTDDSSKAKKQKLDENVDPYLISDIASKIPRYRIVKESEINSIPKTQLRSCLLTVPYVPYPFEPELLLCQIKGANFAYRFQTEGDPNTNTSFRDQQGSANPTLPKFVCLQCGISFSRAWVSRRHSLNIHNVKTPVYKRVYITQTP